MVRFLLLVALVPHAVWAEVADLTDDVASCESGPLQELAEIPPANWCPRGMQGAEWVDIMRNRSGITRVLVNQVATAYPVGTQMGINDLTGPPINMYYMWEVATPLSLSLHVKRVTAINQKTQQFELHYSMRWFWSDCRVACSCAWLGVGFAQHMYKNFWKPPWRLLQSERTISTTDELRGARHTIMGSGYDIFETDEISIARCSFDYREMPFDVQTCNLTFSLPGYPNEGIGGFSLHWGQVTSAELANAEWDIDQGDEWRKFDSNLPNSMGFSESQLTAQFTLRRQPAYLDQTAIMPAAFVYVVSWAGLWINIAAVPARAAIAVIPILVLTTKMSQVASVIPPISYDTRLSTFLMMTLILITIHGVEFAALEYAGRRAKVLAERIKQHSKVHVVPPTTVGGQAEQPAARDEENAIQEPTQPRFERVQYVIMKGIAQHGETHLRWISPLVFIIASLIILYA